jgi:hypothetical protein
VPLRAPEAIDLEAFNLLVSSDYLKGQPIKDVRRLFYKEIILDDENIITSETIKTPGFIGIADDLEVLDPQQKTVSGHEDIVQYLDRDGLLICSYQYNKDRYGKAIDLRWPPTKAEFADLMEVVIKNEGHHAGAIVPAVRDGKKAFASFNEPDEYYNGLYGDKGFIAVAQRLVFPDFISPQQRCNYTNSIISWMALINPFSVFTNNNFNGGDPTHVCDRTTLKEFLKNCLLASLGSNDAIEFLNRTENKLYCAEFMYISLNTLIYPFNKSGLTQVLDGDEVKAIEILNLRDRQNSRRHNLLSRMSRNPQFQLLNIQMPVVSEESLPLDQLMIQHGVSIEPNTLPFPPFRLSQLLSQAFHTLLPRQNNASDVKVTAARLKLFKQLEPLLVQQISSSILAPQPVQTAISEGNPASSTAVLDDPKVIAVQQFMGLAEEQLRQKLESHEEFDRVMDRLMEKADELVKDSDLKLFVPPRIYVDLGQDDRDRSLSEGWGFRLETIGTLIHRGVIKSD